MNITIGRILFFCIALYTGAYAQEIQLKILSMNNEPLEVAGVGQPFLLEVVVKRATSTSTQPSIKGLERFAVKGAGFHMRTVNGVTDVTYHYQVRIDQVGEYVLGPAIINSSESGTITVAVHAVQKVRHAKKANKDTSVFLRLETDKKRAMVGEKIPCVVRLYASAPIELVSLIDPDISECINFRVQKKDGPVLGAETIDGIEYKYAQWKFDLYATKAGTCVIPAYAADYMKQMVSASYDPFALFRAMPERKRVYSNAVTITVDQLPSHQKDVDVIGYFTRFHAYTDRMAVVAGEGILLTVELIGEADFDRIPFSLKHMPGGLKWYESKQSIIPEQEQGIERKIFEFVLQPTQAGTLTIPAQSFVYYDVRQQRVKTLKTQPIAINVTEKKIIKDDVPHNDVQKTSEAKDHLEIDVLRPLMPANAYAWPIIPHLWFWFLIISLIVMGVMTFVMSFFQQWRSRRSQSVHALIMQVRKDVTHARNQRKAEALYPLFMTLWAALLKTSVVDVTPDVLEHHVHTLGLSHHEIKELQRFMERLAESAYGVEKDADIYNQALLWLSRLEKIV